MLRGRDVQELKELQRQGMSIQAISKLTGWDRKTIRKYMQAAGLAPEYGPRSAPPSKLDAFKPYLEERLRAGVWNARVLLRELRERNYAGGYSILTDWLRPQRSAAREWWPCDALKRLRVSKRKWTGGIWARWRWSGESRSCTVLPSRWVTAVGWWRKWRWIRSWARYCGCTKPRSSSRQVLRTYFSRHVGHNLPNITVLHYELPLR